MSVMEGAAAEPVTVQGTTVTRRRSPPAAKEQARRKAWGRVWGHLNSHSAKLLKAERD